MKALDFLCSLACMVLVGFLFWSLSYASINPNYQQGLTARRQAVEQTKQVQAQAWSRTVSNASPWLFGGLAAVAVVFLGGKVWIDHQEQRTRRYGMYEDHTTQRHMITAKKDIALAYIAACGDPGAKRGQLAGVEGVFLPAAGEFVPLDVCKQELEQTALVRYEQPPVRSQERVFRVVGEYETWVE